MKYRVTIEFEDPGNQAVYWAWDRILEPLAEGTTEVDWDSFKLERNKGWETL